MKAVKKIKKESIKLDNKNKDSTYYKIAKRIAHVRSLVAEARMECTY